MSFILLAAAATAICRLIKGQTGIGLAVALYACICLVIVAFIYSYFNQIKQVEVTADKVVIRKVYGAITISRKEILYARHRKRSPVPSKVGVFMGFSDSPESFGRTRQDNSL